MMFDPEERVSHNRVSTVMIYVANPCIFDLKTSILPMYNDMLYIHIYTYVYIYVCGVIYIAYSFV